MHVGRSFPQFRYPQEKIGLEFEPNEPRNFFSRVWSAYMFLFSETIKIESDNSHVPRRLETIAHAIPQFIIVKCGMCICVASSVDGEGFGVDAC